MKKTESLERNIRSKKKLSRIVYTKQEHEIDRQLSDFVKESMDEGIVGFIVSSDIQRMVFLEDYNKILDALKRQRQLSMIDENYFADYQR